MVMYTNHAFKEGIEYVYQVMNLSQNKYHIKHNNRYTNYPKAIFMAQDIVYKSITMKLLTLIDVEINDNHIIHESSISILQSIINQLTHKA